MSIQSIIRRMSSLALCFALAAPIALQAEDGKEGTVEAFSSWEARGQMYPTGPAEATFVGVLSGVLYVKDDDSGIDASSIDAGLISCPGTLVINTNDGSQSGHGKCVIITADSERIYAEFKCTGEYLAGCNGEFTLRGGSGEKANISGGGPIQFKSAFSNLNSMGPGSIVEQSSVGLAVWPKLSYKLQ